MPVHVYIERIEGLDILVSRLNEHPLMARRVLHNFLKQLASRIKGNAQKNLTPHSRTRTTLQGVIMRVNPDALTALIGTNQLVGLYLEKGTKPHTIAARNARALMLPVTSPTAGGSPFTRTHGPAGAWRLTGTPRAARGRSGGAQLAFFKSVHHPGQRATPWLMPAYRSAKPFQNELLKIAGQQIVDFLAHGRPI